ncbi:hypothetical protein BDZ45DRAFT_683709 [Acephala macrosclerotiorum]|nr:hypothetical protein BDZ45DRAFT_683709 [Acephala macrosclerotiorum]
MVNAEMEAQRDLARHGRDPGTIGWVVGSDIETTSEDESNRPAAAKKGKTKRKKSTVKFEKKGTSQPKKKVLFTNQHSETEDAKITEATSREPTVDTCNDNNSDSSASEELDTEEKKKRAVHAPTPAVFGKKGNTKLIIQLDTVMEDKEHEGQYTSSKVVYNYLEIPGHAHPDWNNKDEIWALNKWRRQIFKRSFRRIRKTRPLWLLSEKKLILDLVVEQLKAKPKLKWKRLANRYNSIQNSVVQQAGEKFLSKGKKKEEVLGENRTAPWRTKGSIDAKSKHKKKAAEKRLSADGDDSDARTSGDDKEVPDPNPEPKETTKQKASGTTKSKIATTSPPTSLPGQNSAKKKRTSASRKRKSESLEEDVAGADFDTSIWDAADGRDDGKVPPSSSMSKRHRKW